MRLLLSMTALGALFVFAACSSGSETSAPTATAVQQSDAMASPLLSPSPSSIPLRTPEPESQSFGRAVVGTLSLEDMPSGFSRQSSNTEGTSATNPTVLAVSTITFVRQPTLAEMYSGAPITIGNVVTVFSNVDAARTRIGADLVKKGTVSIAEGVYKATNVEAKEISFAKLGEESIVIEATGKATIAGQENTTLAFRSVVIRKGRLVGLITTTGLALGSISDLEALARRLEAKLNLAASP